MKSGYRIIAVVFAAFAAACSSPARKEPDVDAVRLTEQAYSSKKRGMNKEALELLAKAHEIIAAKNGAKSPNAASNLDDQASIYMRTGDFGRARELFAEARKILQDSPASDPSLLSGVEFRLFLLQELERRKIVCNEPLETNDSQSADPVAIFPDMALVHRAIGKLNPAIAGCAAGKPHSLNARVVVTGDGTIVAAKILDAASESEEAKCVEQGILNTSIAIDLPHFRACFISFTFSFKVGEIAMPRSLGK